MKTVRGVSYVVACLALLLFLAQCGQRESELSPKIAGLVGTWRLVAPDSTFKTTLTIALDKANPPRDITPLLATGQSAVDTYSLRLFATVDGTMSTESWLNTQVAGAPAVMTFEQTYFQNLQAVVRYELTIGNRLYLYHGGSQPHVLTYERIK